MHGTGIAVRVGGCEVSVFVCYNPDTEETRKYQTNGWHASTCAIPLVSGCSSPEEATNKAKEMLLTRPDVLERHTSAMSARQHRRRGCR